MSSKYPVLPPLKIIKTLQKLGFEKISQKVVMLNIKIMKQEKFILFQCIVK